MSLHILRVTALITMFALGATVGHLYTGPRSNYLVAHDQRMQWASDTIVSQPDFDGKGRGVYDWCLDKSLVVRTVGPVYEQHSAYKSVGLAGDIQPVGLSNDFHTDVQDACALILIGGEW